MTDPARAEDDRRPIAAAGLVAAAAVAAAALVTWGANRGFGMVDEGLYLVLTSRGIGGVTWYGAIVHRMLPWACDDIVALRHVRLALFVAAAIGFGTAAWRWAVATGMAPRGRATRVLLVAAAFLGASLGWAWLPQTLNYNDLNEAASLAAGAALLAVLARAAERPDEPPSSWLVATIGFVHAWQFFVKAPAAGLGGVLALALLVWTRPSSWFRTLGSYAAGLVAGAALFFAVVAGPGEWWTELQASLVAVSGSTHGAGDTLGRYRRDAWSYVRMGRVFAPALLVAIALTVSLRRRAETGLARVRAAFAAVVAVALAAGAWRREFSNAPHEIRLESLLPYVALLVTAAACALSRARGGEPVDEAGVRRARTAGVAWLVLAPAAAAFGTNNHLPESMIGHLAAWFVLATVLAFRLGRQRTAFPGVVATSALLVAGAGLQLWGGYMTEPRGLAAPRLAQTSQAPSVPHLRGLLLDEPTRDLHEGLWKALRAGGFRDGDPVIGLFDHPALVFTMDGRYPGVLWPVGGAVTNGRVNLALAPREAVERSYLLVDSGDAATEATRLLQAAKLPFPDGYRVLGTFPNPFTNGTLTAYGPPRTR